MYSVIICEGDFVDILEPDAKSVRFDGLSEEEMHALLKLNERNALRHSARQQHEPKPNPQRRSSYARYQG